MRKEGLLQMLQKANIHKSYRSWLGMITLVGLGIGLWFFYDGAITYPKQYEAAAKYREMKEAGKADEWKDVATEKDWPIKHPEKLKTKADSTVQFILAGTLAIPGLLCLFFYLLTRSRWIEMDDDGFRTSWGQKFQFEEIFSLGKKKWESKGIAIVRYKQNGKRKRRLVLDDWKFDTDETKAMVREIEAKAGVDIIVGGPPEPPLETNS
jgi:hypothetical protein